MKIGVIAFSGFGETAGALLRDRLTAGGHAVTLTRCPAHGLAAWTNEHFSSDDALIFLSAAGIAVRAIAPLVHSKTTDPAVLVLDDHAHFVIPLLSGHIGGANALAEYVAELTGATPVVTTATDVSGVFAVDTWAKSQGLLIENPERIKDVSSRLLDGDPVGLASDLPIGGAFPRGVVSGGEPLLIRIGYHASDAPEALHLIAPALTLGIGCRHATEFADIESAYSQLLAHTHVHPLSIRQVCSIDLKAGEPGLLQFCANHGLPFVTYPADVLNTVTASVSSSAFVRKITGTDNVCERSALCGAGADARLLVAKTIYSGVTVALAAAPYPIRF